MKKTKKLKASIRLKSTGAAISSIMAGMALVSAAQAQESVRWQVPIGFGSHLVGLGSPIVHLSETLKNISDDNINLRYYEPGELIPPFEILDAVSEGRYPAGYTWIGYDQGSIPVLPLLSGPPFGMEPPAFMAWHYFGDGDDLLQEVYEPYGIKALLCGVIGPEAAGWFAEPLESLEQIEGLRIRFAGIGGRVMENLGASVTMLPGGELYQAMERGTIDALEFSAPVVDRILGLQEIVQNYVMPGWHQTYTTSHLLVNKETWDDLSDLSRAQIEVGCRSATLYGFSVSEWENPQALASFESEGVNAQALSSEILAELEAATMEVLDEMSTEDEIFGRVLKSQREWMEVHGIWHHKGYLPRSYYAPKSD